jgi:hypothetical protein
MILLQASQVTELFFKVCAKIANPESDFSELADPTKMHELKNLHGARINANRVTRIIENQIVPKLIPIVPVDVLNKKGKNRELPPNTFDMNCTFYSIYLALLHQKSFEIEDDVLQHYMNYICESKDEKFPLGALQSLSDWKTPPLDVLALYNTSWVLYHYAEDKETHGVLECTFELLSFNHARLYEKNIKDNSLEIYEGSWHKEESLLFLNLQSVKKDTRKLQIKLHWEIAFPQLAIGQFWNRINALISGKVIVFPLNEDKYKDKDEDEDETLKEIGKVLSKSVLPKQSKYIPFSKKLPYVPQEVWVYLKKKESTTLSVQKGVCSFTEFNEKLLKKLQAKNRNRPEN